MKVRAIIQARMLSQRLRGKTLMAIAEIPLLYRVVNAVKSFPFVDEVMIATTRSEADDPIAAAANNLGVYIFRGDSVNVLRRFNDAAADLDEEDQVLRFTADNPIYHVGIAQQAFEAHVKGNFDYTHIDGLSHIVPEFIKVRALRETHSLATENFDKEHVTPFLRKHQNDFKLQTLPRDFGGLRNDLDRYLTVDTKEDLHRFEELLTSVTYDGFNFTKVYDWLDSYIASTLPSRDHGLAIKLGNAWIGDGYPTFVIAEIGQNHNGDVQTAKNLIDMAVRCGADAVKFQKRDIPSELTREAFDRAYDSPNSFGKTYGEHRIFLELNEEQHLELKEYAMSQGVPYFCTPCDVPSVEMMERIGVPFYKVASRDLTNLPALAAMAKTGKPVIISTGMASHEDIEDALEVLGKDRQDIVILQCVSQYPADMENVNLQAMHTLRERYHKITGFSDHTAGIIASVAASVMGAAVIEKHITLSRAMKGSDQAGSLEEPGLKKMIEYIRLSEKAKGDGVKVVNPATLAAKEKLARSVTSNRNIPKGTVVTEDMLCLKSPGTGLSWKNRSQIVGKISQKDIEADTTLSPEFFA
ncbi:N-acetylneuraminate synthase family protein [Lewinella sp. JB7]|uniref:N-acetylneuraminate synthase family protein n=1 Tax=Lewinella sp. JB7 TaxID=2962887 RepID=UPI0020C98249|nr:N-acetylneuraminate synthase family protein [Lewinella sp. JB7]MCP9236787.1 N-acetylneuraminate synthase family protein [Lewinella sp. JB7]